MNFEEFKNNVEAWAEGRGIYEHSTARAQLLKTLSELGELSDAVIKDDHDGLKDAVGDVAVCVINYAKMTERNVEHPMFDPDEPNSIDGLIGELAHAIGTILTGETQGEFETQFILCCLAGICQRKNLDFLECLNSAWNEIKDRKGFLSPSGAFIKQKT